MTFAPPPPSATRSAGGEGKKKNRGNPARTAAPLEADPEDPARLIASTRQTVIRSSDEGKTWRERDRVPNVRFTWPEPDALYRIDPGGAVGFSADGGETFEERGTSGGEPQAMFADTVDHIVVALIDGTIRESSDGGRTWKDLLSPP